MCSVFLIMFPEYILMSCTCVITYLVQCVLVLRCGSAGWCGILMQAEAVLQPALRYHTTPAKPQRNTNTHRTRYVITHTHDIKIYSCNIIKNTLHTRELKNQRTPQQPIFTETRLLKQPHTSRHTTRY